MTTVRGRTATRIYSVFLAFYLRVISLCERLKESFDDRANTGRCLFLQGGTSFFGGSKLRRCQ